MATLMAPTRPGRVGSRDQQALLLLVAAACQHLPSGRVLTAEDVRRAVREGRRTLPARARGHVGRVAGRYEDAVVQSMLADPGAPARTVARHATELWMSQRRW